jgi:hypothetical protein
LFKHHKQANEIFDNISYCKGASIISFVESYIGADAIRSGLREYIAKLGAGRNTPFCFVCLRSVLTSRRCRKNVKCFRVGCLC